MLEAAEVHIGRANSSKFIIRHHQFGVQKTYLIKINFHTSLQYIRQIGTRT